MNFKTNQTYVVIVRKNKIGPFAGEKRSSLQMALFEGLLNRRFCLIDCPKHTSQTTIFQKLQRRCSKEIFEKT